MGKCIFAALKKKTQNTSNTNVILYLKYITSNSRSKSTKGLMNSMNPHSQK